MLLGIRRLLPNAPRKEGERMEREKPQIPNRRIAVARPEIHTLADFEQWLDGELRKLEARWAHAAAPAAQRPRLPRRKPR